MLSPTVSNPEKSIFKVMVFFVWSSVNGDISFFPPSSNFDFLVNMGNSRLYIIEKIRK